MKWNVNAQETVFASTVNSEKKTFGAMGKPVLNKASINYV